MILDIVGASASWENNKFAVAFDVVPEGRSHLDLKTGEIFQSDRFAAMRDQKDKTISAKLFVSPRERNSTGEELPREMRYSRGGRDFYSEIYLVWRLPDDHLAGFHALILAGMMPQQAIVHFLFGALKFGSEPDGSGQTWDNETSPAVPIESIRFDFSFPILSGDRPWDTEMPAGEDRAFFLDTARVNFLLLRKLSAIEYSIRGLGWMILIALLMLILLFRFWH